MKCAECGKDVIIDGVAKENWMYGFESEEGNCYHHGCAMMMPRMPKRVGTTELRAKMDEILDRRQANLQPFDDDIQDI